MSPKFCNYNKNATCQERLWITCQRELRMEVQILKESSKTGPKRILLAKTKCNSLLCLLFHFGALDMYWDPISNEKMADSFEYHASSHLPLLQNSFRLIFKKIKIKKLGGEKGKNGYKRTGSRKLTNSTPIIKKNIYICLPLWTSCRNNTFLFSYFFFQVCFWCLLPGCHRTSKAKDKNYT